MAEKVQLKEDLKKTINSILCGYKEGATPREILQDYDLLTGDTLPFRELGYSHIEHLLDDFSDVVYKEFVNGRCVLKPVPNEDNQRIINLVARQRAPESKRRGGRGGRGRGGYRGGRGGRGGYRGSMPPIYPSYSSYPSYPSYRASNNYRPQPVPQPVPFHASAAPQSSRVSAVKPRGAPADLRQRMLKLMSCFSAGNF